MALSGQTGWVGKWQDTHRYYIAWTATQNASNNQSTITVKWMLQLMSDAGAYGTGSVQRYWELVCSGTTKSGYIPTNTTLSAGATYTMATTTYVLSHGSDGKLTFTLSGKIDTPGGGGYATVASHSFTLDDIPQGRVYTKVGSSIVSGQVYIKVGSTIYPAKDVYIGITGNIPKKAIV